MDCLKRLHWKCGNFGGLAIPGPILVGRVRVRGVAASGVRLRKWFVLFVQKWAVAYAQRDGLWRSQETGLDNTSQKS